MPFASGDYRARKERVQGNGGSKELLFVDVAAKNLLERLVATFLCLSYFFFPHSR